MQHTPLLSPQLCAGKTEALEPGSKWKQFPFSLFFLTNRQSEFSSFSLSLPSSFSSLSPTPEFASAFSRSAFFHSSFLPPPLCSRCFSECKKHAHCPNSLLSLKGKAKEKNGVGGRERDEILPSYLQQNKTKSPPIFKIIIITFAGGGTWKFLLGGFFSACEGLRGKKTPRSCNPAVLTNVCLPGEKSGDWCNQYMESRLAFPWTRSPKERREEETCTSRGYATGGASPPPPRPTLSARAPTLFSPLQALERPQFRLAPLYPFPALPRTNRRLYPTLRRAKPRPPRSHWLGTQCNNNHRVQ